MAQQATISAEIRDASGTGAARAARRERKVPGIVYGAGRDNMQILVDRDLLTNETGKAGFFNHIYKLEVGGDTIDVLPRDLQLHPVTDAILHVDFLAVRGDTTIAVDVPVAFLNQAECRGLKRGGVLNIVRHEVELYCPANAIPEQLVIDLAGLDIGDSVHISMIALPEGVRPVIEERDFTIATIAAPTVVRDEAAEAAEGEDEEEAAEAAEGEEGEDEEREEG